MNKETGNTEFIEGRVTISSLTTDHILTKLLAKTFEKTKKKTQEVREGL